MKKIVLLVIVLLVATLIFSACGGNDDVEKEIETDSMESAKVTVKSDEMTIKTDETEVNYSTDMKSSVEVPENYPSDILPIYEGTIVSVAAENADGSFAIIGYIDEDGDKIIDYYKEALMGAEVIMETNNADNYMNMGNFKGATYTVNIGPPIDEVDYKTMISLIVLPDQLLNSEMSNSEPMEVAEFVVPEGITIPEEYPEDILPFYKGAGGEIAIVENNGRRFVGYSSMAQKDDLVYYYEDLLYDVVDLETNDMDTFIIYKGVLEGINFEIAIAENNSKTGVDMKFPTVVQVFY